MTIRIMGIARERDDLHEIEVHHLLGHTTIMLDRVFPNDDPKVNTIIIAAFLYL